MTARQAIENLIWRRRAFRGCFLGPDGKPTPNGRAALQELRRFCYGNKPTLKQGSNGLDPYASIAAAARQEVYMRVMGFLNLDDSDLNLMAKNMEMTADG